MERVEIHTFKNNEQVGIIDMCENWTVGEMVDTFRALAEFGFEGRIKRFVDINKEELTYSHD